MQKNKSIITLGIIVALLPLLGFPRAWESFFQVVIGLTIVLISVWAAVDKKLTLKAKAQQRQMEKVRRVEEQTKLENPVEDPSADSAFGETKSASSSGEPMQESI